MANVFISYARTDRDRAQIVAQALEKQGFTVWWDRKIPPGKTFDQVIQEALDASSCVIVLWSATSVRSDWVKEEAQNGAARGVLVPALIDGVPIPLGFGRIQTANLVGWHGDLGNPEFQQLSSSVAETVGLRLDAPIPSVLREDETAGPPRPEIEPPLRRAGDALAFPRAKRRLSPVAATLVLLLVAAGGVGYYLYYQGALPWTSVAGAQPSPGEEPPGESRVSDPAALQARLSVRPASGPVRTTGAEVERELATVALEPAPEGLAVAPVPTPEEVAAVAAERRREAAIQALAELQLREAASETGDAELLAGYQKVWSEHFADLDTGRAEELAQKIAALEASAEAFAELEGRSGSEDLTMRERLGLWQGYRPARPGGPEARHATSEIEKLMTLMTGSATIAGDDKLVTARDLRRDDEGKVVGPSGVAEEFPPGNVYLFAWVRSPGSETLGIEWRDGSGEVLQSQSTRVGQNLAPGYRLAYSRSFSKPGEYEVRLYNQGGHLIGRRGFRIRGS